MKSNDFNPIIKLGDKFERLFLVDTDMLSILTSIDDINERLFSKGVITYSTLDYFRNLCSRYLKRRAFVRFSDKIVNINLDRKKYEIPFQALVEFFSRLYINDLCFSSYKRVHDFYDLLDALNSVESHLLDSVSILKKSVIDMVIYKGKCFTLRSDDESCYLYMKEKRNDKVIKKINFPIISINLFHPFNDKRIYINTAKVGGAVIDMDNTSIHIHGDKFYFGISYNGLLYIKNHKVFIGDEKISDDANLTYMISNVGTIKWAEKIDGKDKFFSCDGNKVIESIRVKQEIIWSYIIRQIYKALGETDIISEIVISELTKVPIKFTVKEIRRRLCYIDAYYGNILTKADSFKSFFFILAKAGFEECTDCTDYLYDYLNIHLEQLEYTYCDVTPLRKLYLVDEWMHEDRDSLPF